MPCFKNIKHPNTRVAIESAISEHQGPYSLTLYPYIPLDPSLSRMTRSEYTNEALALSHTQLLVTRRN